MAQRIRKDDTVIVIAGNSKKKTGKVLAVNYDTNRVVVEGLNKITRHMKPTQKNQTGGIVTREAPLHLSNVMLLDGNGKGSRVAVGTKTKGAKARVRTLKTTKAAV